MFGKLGFSSTWKMVNLIPINRKESKQLVKNCRPVSLLPICCEISEILI